MPQCNNIRFTKSKLCAGDLIHYIEIQTRSMGETLPGETSPSEVFTTLKPVWSGIKTPELQGSGTVRFSGVTIQSNTTHLFYIFYDPDLKALEVNNNFILYDGQRYALVSTTIMGEDKETIMIQASLTGIATEEASEA